MEKVVTFREAHASGKPFRAAKRFSTSHADTDGHVWRVANGPNVACTECVLVWPTDWFEIEENRRCFPGCVDQWIIQKSEDEFEEDANKILSDLGLKVKEPETA